MMVFGIDVITWGIWLLGFIILIVWIYIPIKEFKSMIKERNNAMKDTK